MAWLQKRSTVCYAKRHSPILSECDMLGHAFLLSLLIRYPEAIAQMRKQLRQTVEQIYAKTHQPDEPATFAEYEAKLGTNELARVHGKLMMDLMLDSKM